jgi:hypothetical protein
MTKEKIDNINHFINYTRINMNNEDYIDNIRKLNKISKIETKININLNKNLINNLNRKNRNSIKLNRYIEQCRKNKNEFIAKNIISRKANDLFNEIHEKKKKTYFSFK